MRFALGVRKGFQRGVDDFQVRDGLVGLGLEPAKVGDILLWQFAWHVAVALAKDAEEERAAAVDFLEADV